MPGLFSCRMRTYQSYACRLVFPRKLPGCYLPAGLEGLTHSVSLPITVATSALVFHSKDFAFPVRSRWTAARRVNLGAMTDRPCRLGNHAVGPYYFGPSREGGLS